MEIQHCERTNTNKQKRQNLATSLDQVTCQKKHKFYLGAPESWQKQRVTLKPLKRANNDWYQTKSHNNENTRKSSEPSGTPKKPPALFRFKGGGPLATRKPLAHRCRGGQRSCRCIIRAWLERRQQRALKRHRNVETTASVARLFEWHCAGRCHSRRPMQTLNKLRHMMHRMQ